MPPACAVELDQNARADGALHRDCRGLIARDPTRSATSHHEEVCHGKTSYSETFYAKIFYFKVCDENIRIGRSA
jgi:hypothetical protein